MVNVEVNELGFNSKVVRLKESDLIVFAKLNAGFNSKVVRLKDSNLLMLEMCVLRFNSKVVRLKEEPILVISLHQMKFQFQSGAIKSWRASFLQAAFNAVSIPKWCD